MRLDNVKVNVGVEITPEAKEIFNKLSDAAGHLNRAIELLDEVKQSSFAQLTTNPTA